MGGAHVSMSVVVLICCQYLPLQLRLDDLVLSVKMPLKKMKLRPNRSHVKCLGAMDFKLTWVTYPYSKPHKTIVQL